MSAIYEQYYTNKSGEEIPFYVGKSKNVVERISEHLSNSIVDSHTVLYKYINNELDGGWESVKFRILHQNLPADSNHPVVCYFERLYYDNLSKKYTLYNSCPPLLSVTPVNPADIKKYKKFQVPNDALINNVVNAYLTQLIKIQKFNNVNELSQKYRQAMKDKSILAKNLKDKTEQFNETVKDKNFLLKENEDLKKVNNNLNTKIDKACDRVEILSDKLIDVLSKRELVPDSLECLPNRRSKRQRINNL